MRDSNVCEWSGGAAGWQRRWESVSGSSSRRREVTQFPRQSPTPRDSLLKFAPSVSTRYFHRKVTVPHIFTSVSALSARPEERDINIWERSRESGMSVDPKTQIRLLAGIWQTSYSNLSQECDVGSGITGEDRLKPRDVSRREPCLNELRECIRVFLAIQFSIPPQDC